MDQYKRIREYVIGKYQPVKVVPGKCRWNRKCHLNSVHDAVVAGETSIAMCVYLDTENEPIIHFLNKKGKVYTDNTLGYWSHENTYYLIREIPCIEFDGIGDVFKAFRSSLIRLVPWYVRLFTKVTI